jgi:small redox-active disulfide protein 2
MQTIKILGTGCPNCKRTEAVVKTVLEELNCKATVIKVEDIQEIMEYDIMSTPAIVIDEKVVLKGHIPSFEEMKTILTENSCCNDTDTSCCGPSDTESSSNCC